MCLSTLSALCMHDSHAWCPWTSQLGIGSLRSGDTDGCEPLGGEWGLSPGPLQEASIQTPFSERKSGKGLERIRLELKHGEHCKGEDQGPPRFGKRLALRIPATS